MRILILDQFSEFGGAQLCLRDILSEIRRRNWSAELMAPGHGPMIEIARGLGFEATSLPLREYATIQSAMRHAAGFAAAMVRCRKRVRSALRERQADLVYVNGPRVLPLAVQADVPVLLHAHSLVMGKSARIIANVCLRQAGATALACSQFAAAPVRKALGDAAVRVVYNGVADCGFRARHATGRPLRVGVLGRIAPEKGYLDFIEAAHLLKGDRGLLLTIIGSGLFSGSVYERRVRLLGAAAGVEFRGWSNDVAAVLNELDVLAIPSAAHEASTRVALEAFSAGACVIAYPSGGLPELIRHGETGWLTERRDPEELARAIRILGQDAELRRRLAENGRREWERRFTVERFRREICDQMEAVARPQPKLAASATRSMRREPEPARDEARA